MSEMCSGNGTAAVNVRLSVREAVARLYLHVHQTVHRIARSNIMFQNTSPVDELLTLRLRGIYDQLQYSVLSPSNQPPASDSVLRFLSEASDESESDIIRRFDTDQRQEPENNDTAHLSPVAPSAPVNIPRLQDLTSDRSSRNNSRRCLKSGTNEQKSISFSRSGTTCSVTSSASNSCVWSKSSVEPTNDRSSNSQQNNHEEASSPSFVHRTKRSSNRSRRNGKASYRKKNVAEVRKTAEDVTAVVLKKDFIPTAPLLEERATNTTPVKPKKAVSSCSSLHSEDDKVTVRYIPSKISTKDAAVSTDPMMTGSSSVSRAEVGVNTVIEIGCNVVECSSSSNTASDISAGQLPKQLFDAVLQKPSLKIISLRPDGSIVPANTPAPHHLPKVQEWTLPSDEKQTKQSVSSGEVVAEADPSCPEEKEELDSVSASTSRPDPSEEDLNTMANISPLPHC